MSKAQALEEVFMDLVPRAAARCSRPTLSTPGSENNQRLRLAFVMLLPMISEGSIACNLAVWGIAKAYLLEREALTDEFFGD
jgi:hypothetical protein